MNSEELKEAIKRIGLSQQECIQDLEIIWQQIQYPVGLDLLYQCGKNIIEFKQFTINWKLANKILMQIVKICLNNKDQLKAWETLRLIIDPDKHIYKCHDLVQQDVNQYSHQEFTQQEFCANLEEDQDIDALYEDEKGNVIGWCRGKIIKLNDRYVWVKWYGNDEKRKINRYSMDIAPFKSKINDEEWEWRHNLKIGEIIDCIENRIWQNATIIAILNDEEMEYIIGFRIYDEKGNQYDSMHNKFYGWNQQYDERIKAISPRIQQKDKYSKGQLPNQNNQEEMVHDCNDFLYPLQNNYAVPRFNCKQAKRSQLICEMINEFEQIQNKCTIDYVHNYMLLLQNMYEMLHKDFIQEYVPQLLIQITNNILQSSDNNLRNFSIQKINDILQSLSNLLKRIEKQQKKQEIIDKLDLEIAYKCFTSDFLERKIQGLKSIQEVIKKIKDQYNQYGIQEQQKIQSTQMIIEWLNEKKIFDNLYVTQGNQHLVQRSAEFFKFLLEEKIINIQNLKDIWQSLDKAEHEHKLAIYKLLKDVSNSFDREQLSFITDVICNKDPKEVTKDDLELLPDIIKANYKFKEEYIQKCCNYYWNVLKSGQLNQQQLDQYVTYYIDLVTVFEMKPYRSSQILMIGESIIKNEQVNIALKVLIKLIEKQDIQPAAWEQFTRNIALTELESKYKIVEEIIKSIPQLKKQKDYLDEIKIRMQFIQFFYQNINTYEYRLTFKIISSIWDLLVCQSQTQQEKDLVYKWFSTLSNQDGQSQLTSMVNIQDLKIFFQEKMTNDLKLLTEEGFNCFKTVLTAINKQENEEFGVDILWQIILETENEKVYQQAIDYYHSFQSNLNIIFNKLQENRNNNIKLYRSLLVLEDYIDFSEINGVGNLKSLSALSQGEELQIQIYYEQSLQKKYFIKIYDNQTIIELRLAISKIIKQQWDSIGLNSQKGEIKFTENGKMIRDLRLKKGEIIIVFKKTIKEIQEANLLDGDKLSEQAEQVFGEIFSEYSQNGKMTKEDCTRFVTGCTGNPCSIDDANIQKTFEQYDKDKDSILTLKDFLEFYTDSARTKRNTVWLNLQTLHYRNDLIRGDRVPLPQINAQYLPRGQIVQNQQQLDLLFEFLQNSNQDVQEKTWYLLRRLPPSPLLIKQMLTFENIKQSTDWDIILVNSHYRLLYSLYIIEFLMNQQDSNDLQALVEQEILQLKDKWMSKFLQLGGFDKLLQFFKQYQGRSVNNLPQIEKEILSFLLKTFQNYTIAASATNVSNLYQASRSIQLNKSLDQVLLDIRQQEEPEEFKLLVQKLKESKLADNIIEKIEKFMSVLIDLIQELLKTNELEQEDRQIIEHSIITIIIILLHNQDLLNKSIQNIEFLNIFFSGIFTEKSDSLRNLFSRGILVLCHESQKLNNQPTKVILQQLISMQNSQGNSSQYYELLSQLIDSAFELEVSTQFIDFEQLAQQTLDNLINYKGQETRQKNTIVDKILIGLLNLLAKLYKFIKQPIIDIIFSDCLFSTSEEKEIKCKSQESRQAAFKLIQLLCQNQNCDLVLQNLHQLSQKIPNINRWNYVPASDMRSPLGYCGIKNLRCICYMNAMLQQFYMTIPFRYGILQANDNKEPDMQLSKTGFQFDDNVLHQLQQMFSYLELSDRVDYNPQEFCAAFKDYAGEPVNIFIQQDAQEFLNMIFDKLENLLKETSYKNILDGVYGGKTCTQIQCQNCKVIKSKEEIFYNLSLTIKNLKNLQECFDKFVAGELISDFKCENCNQKVDVSKRLLLAQLPNVLILHLQRLVFNLDTFMNEKINSRLEFPIDLDLQQYTMNTDQCTQYKLVGILVHLGTADVGHYFSYIDIKNQDQWLEFNDHKIKEFKMKQMENECFGGQSTLDYNDNDVWGNGFRENSQSAYMLIYEKVQKDKIQLVFNSQQELQESLHKFQNYTIDENNNNILLVDYNGFQQYVPDMYNTKVNSDNQQFLLERNLFNQDFMKFILDTTQYTNKNNCSAIIELLLKFNYDLLARAYDNNIMEQFNTKILQLIEQFPNLNYLDFIYYGKQNKVVDLLLICPESRTRKYFSKLLVTLFNQAIQIENKITNKIEVGLDQLFLMLQDQVPKNWMRFEQYFQFWIDFLNEGCIQIQYLQNKQMILYLIDFILDKNSPLQLYEKKVQMGNTYFPMNWQLPLQIICTMLQLTKELSLNEKKLIYSPNLYDKLFKSCKQEDIIPIILKFSKNNRYYSEIIAGCLMRNMTDNLDELRIIISITKPFLLIEDNLQKERLEWIIGIPSIKQRESYKSFDSTVELPQFGVYGLTSLEEDHWSFSSPLGWPSSLLEYFCARRTENTNQCLLILKLLLMLSLENEICYKYLSQMPCVNYLYKYLEDIFKVFIENYIQETKKTYQSFPRKQEQEETKLLLEQYCEKVSQIHNEFQPQYNYIIGKTIEQIKIKKVYYLQNTNTKEEFSIEENSEGFDLIKQQILDDILQQIFILEEKVYTTYVCDNIPTGITNEALPSQYLNKGTQIQQFFIDPKSQAANFLLSKAWNVDNEEKTQIINPRTAQCVKQISVNNLTKRTYQATMEIKGSNNDCHYIPASKIQSRIGSKSAGFIFFTAMKNQSDQEFPQLSIELTYKKQELRQDSYIYLSSANEMNLELL